MPVSLACYRLCGSKKLEPIINLGQQSFTWVFPKIGLINTPKGKLSLIRFISYTFVQLVNFFKRTILYKANYGYKNLLNISMKANLNSISVVFTKTKEFRSTGGLVLFPLLAIETLS